MGTKGDRKYVIVPSNDIELVDFNEVLETREYLRYSIDGTKFVLKYNGDTPKSISALRLTEYTYRDILPILQEIEWTPEEEDDLLA